MSKAFGSEYIPSVVAITGFEAVKITEEVNKNRQREMELVITVQHSQLDATTGLATSMKATIDDEADNQERSASGMIASGGFGVGATTLSSAIEFGGTREIFNGTLRNANSGLRNVQEAQSLLRDGKASVYSVRGGAANLTPLSDEQKQALLNFEGREDFSQPLTPVEKEALQKVRRLSGERIPGGPDERSQLSRLYKTLTKKFEKRAKSYESTIAKIHDDFRHWCQKLDNAVGANGVGGVVNGGYNLWAADAKKSQAQDQYAQQFAKYVSDSQDQDVQSLLKVYENLNQVQGDLSRSYFSDLARANQAV